MLRTSFFLKIIMVMILMAGHVGAETCTVIMDVQSDQIIHRQGPCEKRYSPVSTFKIPLALMGFDSDILKNPQYPVWHYERGFTVNQAVDSLQTTPTTWLANSVVWYSQKLTTLLGQKKFQHYVDMFDYGNKNIQGEDARSNGLTRSWLLSSLLISPDEQVRFLKKMLKQEYSLKQSAYQKTFDSIARYGTKDGWTLYGKTGSGWQKWEGGENRHLKQGWFVGWAEKEKQILVFARLVLDEQPIQESGGLRARIAFIEDLPNIMIKQNLRRGFADY